MKKIISCFAIALCFFACSKKTTGNKIVSNKAVEKSNAEMLPMPSDDPMVQPPPKKEESSTTLANANPIKEVPTYIKKQDSITIEKKKIILLAEGKETFGLKCGKCHEAYEPKSFSAAKWEKLVDWMAPRAKIEAHEKEAILAYVKHSAKK